MADRFVWTSADGVVVDLTDESAGYSVLAAGTRGLRSVSYALTTQEFAGQDGTQVQAIKATANTPSVGMLLQASSESQFLSRSRGLVHAMRPKAGPGTLTVFGGEGTSRSLTCYVTEGMEGDEAPEVTLPGSWWKFLLKFYAPDPWWQGDARTIDFGLAAPTNFFPIFPLVLSPSSIQGQFTADLSDTDAPTYPVWTITGPGSMLTLTNVTTGRTIQVNATLGDGQTMIIDTRPGQQSVRAGDGTNLMGALASDPALWPLIEGVNSISALLTNANADSRISGVYTPRYAGI